MIEMQRKQNPTMYEQIKIITEIEIAVDNTKLGTDFEKAYLELKEILPKLDAYKGDPQVH